MRSVSANEAALCCKIRVVPRRIKSSVSIFLSEYRDFFDAIVCEDGFDESQFDDDLLNAENWFLCDDGKVIGIEIPALYEEDHSIYFRYR